MQLGVPEERMALFPYAADVGDAEASFPTLLCFGALWDDLRVDDRHRVAVRSRIVIEQRDEQPHPLVDLRRRQSDAVILMHRLDHVVDQLLDQRAAEGRLVERLRALSEDRTPHARDFENRHR